MSADQAGADAPAEASPGAEGSPTTASEERPAGRGGWALGLALLVLAVAFSTLLRVGITRGDVYWDAESPAGLLRSDQGLIYYTAKRIVAAGGGVPDDFRADPKIRHPGTADIPAMFSVGQEFLIAWTYLAFGGKYALHVIALWVMAFTASLAAVGVFGLALECSRFAGPRGKPVLAGLAALLFTVLPINYRTLGILLLREDLSMPLFSAHLWLAARAVRRQTVGAWLACALPLALALSTWHAMNFVVAIEAAAVLAWFARTGRNPLALPRAWIVAATLAVACIAVPMLWSKLFLLSPTMAVVVGLTLQGALEGRRGGVGHLRRVVEGAACVLAVFAAGQLTSRLLVAGESDYGHVVAFIVAKFKGLGAPPSDPSELPFGARLLWQGPFATAKPIEFVRGLGLGLPVLVIGLLAAIPLWVKGKQAERGDAAFGVLGGFLAISVVASWLIRRTMILLGLGVPLLAIWPFLRAGRERWGAALLALITLGHGAFLVDRARSNQIPWYQPSYQPDNYPGEIRHLAYWVGDNVDPDAAFLGDFVISTSILAHSGHRIVNQPKYETTESRDRIEEFFTAFYRGGLDDMKALMRRYEARYLLIDCWQLAGSHFIAGIPPGSSGPLPGSSAAFFLRRDPKALRSIPGFQLRYRTPPGLGRDSFRIFELVE